MYHLKLDQAFKKFSKKQGLIPNDAQSELVKNLENLIEDIKPSPPKTTNTSESLIGKFLYFFAINLFAD